MDRTGDSDRPAKYKMESGLVETGQNMIIPRGCGFTGDALIKLKNQFVKISSANIGMPRMRFFK